MKRPYLLKQIELTFKSQAICALLGPRQAGKTTLARMFVEDFFKNNAYFFDLEDPRDLERLQKPMLAFSQVKEDLIVIDEIQLRPDLFPILKVLVDKPDNKSEPHTA